MLHGNAIGDQDPHGEPIVGDTLAILLNAGPTEVMFEPNCHAEHAPASWQTLVDTAQPPDNDGLVYGPADPVPVPGRTVLLLREQVTD